MRQGMAAVALALSPTVALAYFDPGTGSLLIQALIGGMAAIAVFWGNLKAFVRSHLSKHNAHPAPSAAGEVKSAGHSINSD